MRPILAVGAAAALSITAFSMMSVPAQAQYAQCMPARGCIPTTQASYNACYQLALARGWTESDNARRGGGRGLDYFIFQCLAGKIPR
jgi:uncharacterized protein YcfJ